MCNLSDEEEEIRFCSMRSSCETMSKDYSSLGYSHSSKPPCKFPCHSDDCPYSYMPHNDHSGPIFVIVIENDKMSVQEHQADSTMMDLLERGGRGNARWMPYGFPLKEELRPRLNRQPIGDPTCKLRMGDVVELTPALPDRFLTEHQEENQRMYNRGPTECRAPVLPCACKLSAVSIQERVLNICMICKNSLAFRAYL